MNYEITKLDRRHSWYLQFAYMIEFKKTRAYFGSGMFPSGGVIEFDRSRRWFNEKFGWSQDVETREAMVRASKGSMDSQPDINDNWAYSIKYDDYRIYVKDDAILNWFTLSHSKDHGNALY